jgi:LuxR family maltose regulon positive regulatory protein
VQVELAAGGLAAAQQVALQGDEHLANPVRDMVYHSWAVGIRVHWWLAVGKLEEASEWAEHVVFHQDAWELHRAEEFLMLIRVYLAQQKSAQAVETLERFSAHLDRPADMAITIEFLSLHVVALQQAGMCAQARTVAARLLVLTESEGHIRVYLDAGEAMKEVLRSLLDGSQGEEHAACAVSCSYVSTLLAAFEQEPFKDAKRAQVSLSHPVGAASALPPGEKLSASVAVPVLLEPLTSQEQRVLCLLTTGHTNKEIACALVISLNTVKTHIKNLYRKLQVTSRMQASARARALQML